MVALLDYTLWYVNLSYLHLPNYEAVRLQSHILRSYPRACIFTSNREQISEAFILAFRGVFSALISKERKSCRRNEKMHKQV